MPSIEQCKRFLNGINAMILLPDTPLAGDYIATDWDGHHPSEHKQNISWYCSQVLEVDGNRYKMSYDDQWYTFDDFGTPKPSTKTEASIYPALPPIIKE